MDFVKKGLIFDIQRASFVDGPGIRTTVFFKGCNLKCKWCHNPESQSYNKQMLFYEDKCNSCGKCKSVCPNGFKKCDLCGKCAILCPNDAREVCGREYEVLEVVNEVLKDKDYYGNNGGVTFSGGECMLQIDFLEEVLKECKSSGVNTAVDTAGFIKWENFKRILSYTDLFLYDIKCFSKNLHKQGTGVENGLILENLERLTKEFKGDIIVRIPIIPTFNNSESELNLIYNYLKKLGVKSVELLPYHAMGEHKWKAIGLTATNYPQPTKEEMIGYKKIFNLL